MVEKLDIVAIGESLIELSSDLRLSQTQSLHKYYGGDVLVAAVSASRLGANVGFITKVGNDAFKDYLMDSWTSEGLDVSQVKVASETNGLYFITKPNVDEKELIYYRKKIAPSRLSIEDISEEYIVSAAIAYSSGITQSLSMSAQEAVSKFYELAKKNNVITAYDPNYSSVIHTPDTAKENFNAVIGNIDILFMSTKFDTVNILDMESPEKIIKYLWDLGVSTVILKSSREGGYFTGYNGSIIFTEFYTREVVDTTCSGDAFNGAFMYGITHGYTPQEASKIACIAAGLQAKGIGAVKSVPHSEEVFRIFKQGEC